MTTPFWVRPGAFSPYAMAVTTPEQRGKLRRLALNAGLELVAVTGDSPRGPWTIRVRDTAVPQVYSSDGMTEWRDQRGDLYGLLVGALTVAANAKEGVGA